MFSSCLTTLASHKMIRFKVFAAASLTVFLCGMIFVRLLSDDVRDEILVLARKFTNSGLLSLVRRRSNGKYKLLNDSTVKPLARKPNKISSIPKFVRVPSSVSKSHDVPNVLNDSAVSALIAQRNELAKLLNEAVREVGMLNCERNQSVAASHGQWCKGFFKKGHLTDSWLSKALSEFLQGKTVASFGDGPGLYKKLVERTNLVKKFDSFDGNPFSFELTKGTVKHLDLAVPQFGLPVYDWVLCLEVAEHIPENFEDIFLSNIVRHAKEGVILSWAIPGQGGDGHVNNKPIQYVKQKMKQLGFGVNETESSKLRRQAHFVYFRRAMFVYKRKEWRPEMSAFA